MFLPLWEELRSKNTDFEPITYVTNGVHVPSYTTSIYQQFFTQIDKEWPQKYDLPEYWSKDGQMLARLTDKEIWQRHVSIKKRTITRIRERARNQIKNKVWDSQLALQNGALLDPDTLTIGFARRFATYKRATLIFHDINRLAKMLNDKYRPIQIIFAGKAHPADDAGKKLIKEVIQFTQDTDLGHRIAFIENYDLVSAKMLYEGVDIWLNTPLRPNEASGTSGMKTSVNFIPNVSILDGWWAEGYNGKNGWAINEKLTELSNNEAQFMHDANNLYDLLEKEIIPFYYDRDADNLPRKWIAIMIEALTIGITQFSARRMLKEYTSKLYTKLI
jgi:starch phosphorylase